MEEELIEDRDPLAQEEEADPEIAMCVINLVICHTIVRTSNRNSRRISLVT